MMHFVQVFCTGCILCIFTVLDNDFYLDFVAQNTIKKPASSPVTAQIFTERKAMQTGVHLKMTMLIP